MTQRRRIGAFIPYARIGELDMYYEEVGNANAPPLVLLHGAGGTIDDPIGGWAGLAPSFAERHRVVSVEHRGHGRTNNPDGYMTFEQIARTSPGSSRNSDLARSTSPGSAMVASSRSTARSGTPSSRTRSRYSGATTRRATTSGHLPYRWTRTRSNRRRQGAAEFGRRHDQGKEPGAWKDHASDHRQQHEEPVFDRGRCATLVPDAARRR